jgi:hypothetical protein
VPTTDPTGRSRLLWPALLATGIAFGLLIRLGDSGAGPVVWMVNIAGPWFLVAFLVGALAPSARAAVTRSAIVLVAAVLAKYGLQLAQGEIDLGDAVVRVVAWSVGALLVSLVLGSAGFRSRTAAWPFLLLAALLALEALAFLTGAIDGESAQLRYTGQPAGLAVFVGELTLAVAVAVCGVAACRRKDAATAAAE